MSMDKYISHIIHQKIYIPCKTYNDTYRRDRLALNFYLCNYHVNQPTDYQGYISNSVPKITKNYVPTFSKLSTYDDRPEKRLIDSGHYDGIYRKLCDTKNNIRFYNKDNKIETI